MRNEERRSRKRAGGGGGGGGGPGGGREAAEEHMKKICPRDLRDSWGDVFCFTACIVSSHLGHRRQSGVWKPLDALLHQAQRDTN